MKNLSLILVLLALCFPARNAPGASGARAKVLARFVGSWSGSQNSYFADGSFWSRETLIYKIKSAAGGLQMSSQGVDTSAAFTFSRNGQLRFHYTNYDYVTGQGSVLANTVGSGRWKIVGKSIVANIVAQNVVISTGQTSTESGQIIYRRHGNTIVRSYQFQGGAFGTAIWHRKSTKSRSETPTPLVKSPSNSSAPIIGGLP